MSNIKDYIKHLISGDNFEDEEEVQRKVDIILKGLTLNGDSNLEASIEERIDAIFSTFNIDLAGIGEEQLTQVFKLIKEINLGERTLSDNQFLEKVNIILKLIEIHGFDSIEDISKEDLSKLVEVYNAFTGKSLDEITHESVKKVGSLGFSAVKKLKEVSRVDLNTFIDFIKSLGIGSTSSLLSFKESMYFALLLEKVGYSDGNKWLQKKEQEKIRYLLKELGFKEINSFSIKIMGDIGYVFDQFSIDFSATTILTLRRKIADLKELRILTGMRSKIDIIKKIYSSPKKIEQIDILLVQELFKLIGLWSGTRDSEEVDAIIKWVEEHGVDFSKTEIVDVIKQVESLYSNLNKTVGITLKDIGAEVLTGIDKVLETYSLPVLEEIDQKQSDVIGKILTKLKLSESSKESQAFKLSVFQALKYKCVKGITEDLPESIDKALEKGVQEIDTYFNCKVKQANMTVEECQGIDISKSISEAEYVSKVCGEVGESGDL